MFEIKIEFPGNMLILDESMGPNEVRVVRNERQHPIVRCGIEGFKKMAKIMYKRWGIKPLKVRRYKPEFKMNGIPHPPKNSGSGETKRETVIIHKVYINFGKTRKENE